MCLADYEEFAVEVKQCWRVVLGSARTIAVITLIFLVGGIAAAILQSGTYAATTNLYLSTVVENEDTQELSERSAIASQRVLSYVQILNGNVMAERVRERVGFEFEPDDVEATVMPSTTVMQIQVVGSDPDEVQAVARGYALEAPGAIRDSEVSGSGGWNVEVSVIEEAEKAEPVVRLHPALLIVLSVLLGLGVGVSFVLARALRSQS